jgi:hypothetical protein
MPNRARFHQVDVGQHAQHLLVLIEAGGDSAADHLGWLDTVAMVLHPDGGRIELALIGSERCGIGRGNGDIGLGSVVP